MYVFHIYIYIHIFVYHVYNDIHDIGTENLWSPPHNGYAFAFQVNHSRRLKINMLRMRWEGGWDYIQFICLGEHIDPTPNPHPQGTKGQKGALGAFGVIPKPFRMESHYEWKLILEAFRMEVHFRMEHFSEAIQMENHYEWTVSLKAFEMGNHFEWNALPKLIRIASHSSW